MQSLIRKLNYKQLINKSFYNYHFRPSGMGQISNNPGLTAKRIIKCIGEKLRKVDPHRWNSVPITFKTRFTDEDGHADIFTSIHIHDALEKEFQIDVKDKNTLVTDVETAFYVVQKSHGAI